MFGFGKTKKLQSSIRAQLSQDKFAVEFEKTIAHYKIKPTTTAGKSAEFNHSATKDQPKRASTSDKVARPICPVQPGYLFAVQHEIPGKPVYGFARQIPDWIGNCHGDPGSVGGPGTGSRKLVDDRVDRGWGVRSDRHQ